MSRRRWSIVLLVAVALLTGACTGPFCRDTGTHGSAEYKTSDEVLGRTPTPSTSTATVTATATATASGTPAAALGGKIALGYDHPPFAQTYNVTGGNSIAIVCGALTGVPGGSQLVITLGGDTRQPASVRATIGADGTFFTPFPIMQYGPLTAGIGSVTGPTGAPLAGTVPSASITVASGPDVPCKP